MKTNENMKKPPLAYIERPSNHDTKKNWIGIIAAISFLSLFLVSCNPDCYYNMIIIVTNNTESTLHLEKHKIDEGIHSITYTDIQSGKSKGILFCTYYGSRSDDNPPEWWILENLQNVSICRDVDGSQQELPRKYIDEPSAFEITKDHEFVDCTVEYAITITEDMFSEL